ncbi:MAG: hypothetical protein U0W24_19450 [Bacteroidales bacterium]
MIKFTSYLIYFLFLFVHGAFQNKSLAQQFHRIKADYSIKYKDPQGNQVLQMGVVFYDINSRKIVMKNGFPVREIVVLTDSSIYQIRNNSIFASQKTYSLSELSIFHMALTGSLSNFGLDKTGYQLDTVKNDKGLVLSSWLPPKNNLNLGKILLSTKDKQLFGIVFLNPQDNIIAKHFFRDYTNIKGFDFPTEVLVVTYQDEKEVFHLTKYTNIELEDTKNDEYYNFKIPSN